MTIKKLIENSILEMSAIMGIQCGLYDASGRIIVSTDRYTELDSQDVAVCTQAESHPGLYIIDINGETLYILGIDESDTEAGEHSRILIAHILCMLKAQENKLDKHSLIRGIIKGQLEEEEICAAAARIRLDIRRERMLYLVETREDTLETALEVLRTMYASASGYTVIPVSSSRVALTEIIDGDDEEDIANRAREIISVLNTEAMIQARVAYGEIVSELMELKRAYEQAGIALEVGEIFYSGLNVLSYNKLGLGLLIYRLPVDMCRRYMSGILSNCTMGDIDEDTLGIVTEFFNNNLNISETSRQLYRNRNALTQRIDRLQEQTGLDMRNFHDAVTFDIAIMIDEYLKYIERQ